MTKTIVDLGSYDHAYATMTNVAANEETVIFLVDLEKEKAEYGDIRERVLSELFEQKKNDLEEEQRTKIKEILNLGDITKNKNIKIVEVNKDIMSYLFETENNSVDKFHASCVFENMYRRGLIPTFIEILEKLKDGGQLEIVADKQNIDDFKRDIKNANHNCNEFELKLIEEFPVQIPETTFEAVHLLQKEQTSYKIIFKKQKKVS